MLAATLQEARQARGLSLGALALRAGVNKSTLSRWESGRTVPYAPELERVMEALALSEERRHACWKALGAPRAVRQLEASPKRDSMIAGGELLRALRQRARVTQSEAARAVGVAQATLSQWEHNDAWPGDEKLRRLCAALQATPGETQGLVERGWRTQDELPHDKDALDAFLEGMVKKDTLLERSLLYLAAASRYGQLYRQSHISETDALEAWGYYGHHLGRVSNERLDQPDCALEDLAVRIARPCIDSIARSSRPLTWGQARAFTMSANITISGWRAPGGPERFQRKRALLEALLPRISPPLRSFWHDNLAMASWHVRDSARFDAHSLASIETAETPEEARMRRQRYARLLCQREYFPQPRFDDALTQLQISAEGFTDPRIHINVERETISAWALIESGDKPNAEKHLNRAWQLIEENPAFYERGNYIEVAQQQQLKLAA